MYYLLRIFIISVVILLCDSFTPLYIKLNYSENYNYVINETIEYILDFSAQELKLPPRITIKSSDAVTNKPLMVVARQPKQLISWQLPLILESDSGWTSFNTSSRTLCHDLYKQYPVEEVKAENPIVTVSTASTRNVTFTVRVDYENLFYIKPSKMYNFTISPSEPKYFYYNFSSTVTESKNSNYDTVILEVFSQDSVCMTVSIQNVSCPVFDTNADITFRGFYETVNQRGGITIPKYKFPYGFYAVFVAKADDSDCLGKTGFSVLNRTKTISVIIKPSITYQDYVTAVAAFLSFLGIFYFIFISGFMFCSKRGYIPREMVYVSSEPPTPGTTCTEIHEDNSFDDYDTISEEDNDKETRLQKSIIHLNELAKKDPRVHKYKSYLYLYYVLTVALFYGLPVIQLVITYQRVLNETGQQDLCYYNFLCAHPVGVISDFNHVFSNCGYIFLGLLFLGIVYRRELTHKDLDFDRQYGIPQHYGIFYAMGVALMMEGILSGSYHVCPSKANFQFDSSFMYVMAVLCMVKLYQNRHPDINATAYATFGVLAIAILLGMIGILDGNLYFWILFTIIYIFTCFYLSLKIYYMGYWSFDKKVLLRIWNICQYEYTSSGFLHALKPIHTARFCFLIIGNFCNWILAFWGLYRHQKDFAIFLLAIFMANTLLYFFFYILMKFINKEKLNKLSLFFLTISMCCAISAMYFFLHKSISSSKTPAESRQFNQECKLLRFYDYHDIWHLLSAIGMFFSFMVLLTLDDDLSHTHRTKIVVF